MLGGDFVLSYFSLTVLVTRKGCVGIPELSELTEGFWPQSGEG